MQHGVALVIVLWTIVALALFVASLGRAVRLEAKTAQLERMVLESRAKGEAVIYEALQQMLVSKQRAEPAMWSYRTIGGLNQTPIDLEIIPWNGLININAATEDTFIGLMQHVTSLPKSEAAVIAQEIVKERDRRQSTQTGSWEYIEDLLQVPAMNYGVYAALKPFLVADVANNSRIYTEAAPESLRPWLLQTPSTQVVKGSAGTDRFRVIARVEITEQGWVAVERDVVLRGVGLGSLPWTLLSSRQTWSSNESIKSSL